MNRKGIAAILGLHIIYALMGITVVSGILLRPKHIIRKANERCLTYGGSADICKIQIDNISQAQRIEYIRDTVANPQPENEPFGG